MAVKKHASWMDIPDGNTVKRVYFRDDDARTALAGKASVSDVMSSTITYNGTTYTVTQLLQVVAELASENVVVSP